MKKTFIFGLMATALGFTACNNDDDLLVNIKQEGMVLYATVEQPAETRATINDSEATWKFAFATDDKISVTNSAITGTYYTFTNDGTFFWSTEAQATESEATWYACFPSNEVDLVGQSGTMEAVAGKYALAGKTASATTGNDGLTITMSPKVAILKIYNRKGSIDVNVKVSATEWVKGLTASEDGFTVTKATTMQTLLSTSAAGTYYVAVPAGVQISIKDGDNVIKSTDTGGLTAGNYYELAIGFPDGSRGSASASAKDITGSVNWVQLWEGGPRFAEYNVGVTDGKAESYGGYYKWSSDDIATAEWGDNWRMPTKDEFDNLLANCDVKWIDDNNSGKTGYIFTGRGYYSGNSIFLPAAGYNNQRIDLEQGSCGDYWSSTSDGNGNSYELEFTSEELNVQPYSLALRIHYSVRAVLNEATGATGTATATIGGVNTDVKWVQLWEGGPKFAEYNVGVTDGKAESYGGCYAWSDDIAAAQWGSYWCMPTKADFDNLLAKCDVEWTDDYKNDGSNIKGIIITGKDTYLYNSIFLPAAGSEGREGYWTSTPNGSSEAYGLVIDSNSQLLNSLGISGCSFPVRAVLYESPTPTTGEAPKFGGFGTIQVKWVQLWKDGPKFAEYNVGASSVTEDGGYYAWGSTVDKDPKGTYWNGKNIDDDHDTAARLWGNNWRMPTSEELQALIANCDVEWTTDYRKDGTNIMGKIFTGKGYFSGNSIFLPAAGYYFWMHDEVVKGEPDKYSGNMNYYGGYWSSTPNFTYNDDNAAFYLTFTSGYMPYMDDAGRHMGNSVRAVLVE